MIEERAKLNQWIEGYLSYLLDVSRKAKGTVKDVRCTLRRVSRFFQSHRPDKELWKLSLDDYLRWIEHERAEGTSPQTLAKNVSHIRGLLDYAWRSGRAERNVLDGFSLHDARRQEEPRSLTLAEAKRLVEACPNDTPHERQQRMIVLLLYGCGLRTDELCSLRLQDVNRERKELFIERGKGDRQRLIPIPDAVFTELLAYLSDRGGKRGLLFRSSAHRKRLRPHYVCHVVHQAAERAGLDEDVTPKALRHSFATHLMDRGVDLAIISSLMGHRSPRETGVYLHAFEGNKRAAIDRLNRRRKGGAR